MHAIIAHKRPPARPANNKTGRALVVDSTPIIYNIIDKKQNILFFMFSPLFFIVAPVVSPARGCFYCCCNFCIKRNAQPL
jgi:hypothetical protein